MTTWAWLHKAAVPAVAVAFLGMGTADASAAESGAPDPTEATSAGTYIVTLTPRPSAVYAGSIRGFPATRVTDGARFDHTRPEVALYERHLLDGQDRMLSRIEDPPVLYQMATAFNGFVARLEPGQIDRLRSSARVALVERSTTEHLDAVPASDDIGLAGALALRPGPADAGQGTVVGIIDSGIWPENPSFAGLAGKASTRTKSLAGFSGTCERAERWSAKDCNDKLLAASHFVSGFGASNLAQSEVLSPRDTNGHGSHTAAVAAGNEEVAVEIQGQDFGKVSGLAPAARIASYKACWAAPDPENDGCATSDTVAAIDRAVADGVDVLNYSISGPPSTLDDSVELAFLNAAAGGVFVATSAGNDGARRGAVAHASPWVTTVGATSQQKFAGSVQLGNGVELGGVMVWDEVVRRTRLVLGRSVAAATSSAAQARVCEVGSLDPVAVQDHVVVCERGVTARVEKSAAVDRAGGSAMVLTNVGPDSREADIHSVPTVHVSAAAAADLVAYIRAAERRGHAPTARLDPVDPQRVDPQRVGPQAADLRAAHFSSRGPARTGNEDLLKPDLTAPGVGVVAAVAPSSGSDRLWDLRSGTSTSTAQVTGLAALVQSEKPRWSPVRIKSAMMTTAEDVGSADVFTQGAGQVQPRRVLTPGLAYGTTSRGWRDLAAGKMPARELNQPSVVVGGFTGRARVTRKVTNVSGKRETYAATVSGLAGLDSTVTPDKFTLDPRASQDFEVRLRTRPESGSTKDSTRGALTWTGARSGTRTQIPLVVQSAPVAPQP